MQNLPQSGVDQKSHEMTPHQDATDHFLMQFSSGTTGFPKSAIVSHKARINNILQMRLVFEYSKSGLV